MTHISPIKAAVKGRQDARVQRTRAAFREALLALLDEQAFDQITIRDISARANTGYATFFRHYPDKTALLGDVASAEIRELLSRTLPIVDADDTRAACIELCRYVDAHRRLWSVLLTGGAAANLREEFIRQGREAAATRRPKRSKKKPWPPPDLAVVIGTSGTVELFAWWLQYGKTLTVDEVGTLLDRMVITPVLRF